MPGSQNTRSQEEEEELRFIYRQRIAGRPDLGVGLLTMLLRLCKPCPFDDCSYYTDTTQHMESHLARKHRNMQVPPVVSTLHNIIATAELLVPNASQQTSTTLAHDASGSQLPGANVPAPDLPGMGGGPGVDFVTTHASSEAAYLTIAPNGGIPLPALAPISRAGPPSHQFSGTFPQQNHPARIHFDSPELEDENVEPSDTQAESSAYEDSNSWIYQPDLVNPYFYNHAGTITAEPQGNNGDPFGNFQSVIPPLNRPWTLNQATAPNPSNEVVDSNLLTLIIDDADIDTSFFLGPYPNPPFEGDD